MAKKKNKRNGLLDLLFIFGGLYLIDKLFQSATQPKNTPGIAGIYRREMTPYEDEYGTRYFYNELRKNFTDDDASEIISNMIIPARKDETLEMPFFKTFKGSDITGELRYKQFRILLYKISNDEYLMLNAFKKKSNATPRGEIEKAEKRIEEYQGRV